MALINKSRIDLNLLVIFHTVARTGSVSIAAKELSLSQPAVSHALNRLRDQLGDHLFDRHRNGLVATPRAQAMIEPVASLLQSASDLLSSQPFNPAQDSRQFRIGASEYSHTTVVPALLRQSRQLAPHVSFEFVPVGAETLHQLEQGNLDCSFWGLDRPSGPWVSAKLFRERFVGLVARGHPLAKTRVSIDDYLRFPHISVTLPAPGRNVIDQAVYRLGLTRNVVMSSQNFASAVAALPGTDLIASLPSRFITRAAKREVVTFELPMPRMEYDYSLLWHSRVISDSGVAWLRDIIGRICE